jgi:formylglycine-generating enzyme required for sulfatase activity
LTDGLKIKLVRIPAGQFVMGSLEGFPDEAPRSIVNIDQTFWMGVTEITNQQYQAFDPQHDTRYLDENGKDHSVPGYIANHPNQPVARVSWQQAMEFCKWLSKKSNRKVILPTEAQWEWAARAGSGEQFFYGDKDTDFSTWANLADASRRRTFIKWDGGSKIHARLVDYVKQYQTNPWGLYDIIGNVSEWTRSNYWPYPYKEDRRNDGDVRDKKVARGGSWNDRPKTAGSSVRFAFESHQKVYNVGFRVIIEK